MITDYQKPIATYENVYAFKLNENKLIISFDGLDDSDLYHSIDIYENCTKLTHKDYEEFLYGYKIRVYNN